MYTDGVILIDRQVALAEIDANIVESIPIPEDVYINKGLMIAKDIIEKLPTIKVDTERYGRCKCKCSVCNAQDEMSKKAFDDNEVHYCWRCGSYMI